MWCCIINASLLTFWTILFLLAPEFLYSTQRIFFTIKKDTFNIIMYSFLAFFKIFFIIFNLVPFIALLIVGA